VLLKKFLKACDDYDMDRIDGIMEELEEFEYKTGGDFIIWLRENVDQMNLKEIIDKLSVNSQDM
jgi:hypothetical protein